MTDGAVGSVSLYDVPYTCHTIHASKFFLALLLLVHRSSATQWNALPEAAATGATMYPKHNCNSCYDRGV